MKFSALNECRQTISDEDIVKAMKKIPGYLDITPSDFMEIYRVAYDQALHRLRHAITAEQIMTKRVISVPETAPLADVVRLLADHDISGIPVARPDLTLAGVISEKDFLSKMGGGSQSPPGVNFSEIAWSWLGAFFGITPVALLQYSFFSDGDLVFLIGSFGASAVLIYGAVRSPLAQPRNLVGGHVVSAVIGVAAWQVLGSAPWLAAAFAVATAIAAMHATKTLHPPGGATALIAVIGSEKIHSLGFLYVLFPVLTGVVIMLAVALVVNNIARSRKYPEFWW